MIILTTVADENFLIVENFDIGGVLNLRDQGFFGSKLIAAMNEENFLRNMREIRSGEKGGIATANDGNGLILIESAIASRAIGDAVADELSFVNKIETARRGAGSENDGFGSIGLIASESEMCGGFFEMFNFVVGEGKAERF